MRARTALILAACVAAGVLVPSWIAQQVQSGQLPPNATNWHDAWLFDVNPDLIDEAAWDYTAPPVPIRITWNATEMEYWGGGVMTTQFDFYRVALDYGELETLLGVPLSVGSTTRVFVHQQYYAFPNRVAGDGVRILFYRFDGWYMNKWPVPLNSFAPMHVDRIVSTIISLYGGVRV